MPSSIPQDVVDIIISYLGHDKRALNQCSLTSHSCLMTSRKHLFYTVSLYSAQRCRQLNDLLTTNSSLTTCVRHVYLDGKQKQLDPRRTHCWVSEPTLPVVLRTIAPRLQSLALHCVYWQELSSELQCALLGILDTSNIVSISLVSVHRFPTNQLLRLPHLKRLSLLSLFGVSEHSSRADTRTPGLEKQQLQALEFDQMSQSVKCIIELQRLWDMSRLRELCITASSTRVLDVVSSLLANASQSLELFAWHFQHPLHIVSKPNESVSQMLDISSLSRLRFLLLKSALHDGLVDLLPWLVRSLHTPALRKNLERVIIILDCERSSWDHACTWRIPGGRVWSKIDAAFGDQPKTKLRIVLRGVPVMVHLPSDHTTNMGPREFIASEMPLQMPLLSSARLLCVKVDDDRPGPVDTTWKKYKKTMKYFL